MFLHFSREFREMKNSRSHDKKVSEKNKLSQELNF